MQILRLGFLGLLFASSAFAYSTPPGFDSVKWNQLVAQMITQGSETQSAEGVWRSLSRIVPPDTTHSHQADYISTLGNYDQSGKYVPTTIYDVSESWKLQDGQWVIDQWLYTLAVSGELEQVEHFDLVETVSGHIVKDESLPTGEPTDPAELEHWGKLLQGWF